MHSFCLRLINICFPEESKIFYGQIVFIFCGLFPHIWKEEKNSGTIEVSTVWLIVEKLSRYYEITTFSINIYRNLPQLSPKHMLSFILYVNTSSWYTVAYMSYPDLLQYTYKRYNVHLLLLFSCSIIPTTSTRWYKNVPQHIFKSWWMQDA